MKYSELNLKKVRKDCGLDFAHFTYLRSMCSCCYSPTDLPARYWEGGEEIKQRAIEDPKFRKSYSYILFKNAHNCGGSVTRNDEIGDYVCISYRMPYEKVDSVCKALAEQLTSDYIVLVPENEMWCIDIMRNLLDEDIEEIISEREYTTYYRGAKENE